MTSTPIFHLLTVKRLDGTVRVLYSPRVAESIPCIETVLERAVAVDSVAWPPNVTLVVHDEERPKGDSEHLVVVLPEWLLEKMAKVREDKNVLLDRVGGTAPLCDILFDMAYIFTYYLMPDLGHDRATIAKRYTFSQLLYAIAVDSPPKLRHWILIVLAVIPGFLLLTMRVTLVALRLTKDTDALYVLGGLQAWLRRPKALAATKARLLALGVPAEDVAGLHVKPDLRIVEPPDVRRDSETH